MTIDTITTLVALAPICSIPVLLFIDLWRDRRGSDILFKPVAVSRK